MKRKSFIFKQQLAGFLMQRGFQLLNLKENSKDKSKHIFVFMDTPALHHAIHEYLGKEWQDIDVYTN